MPIRKLPFLGMGPDTNSGDDIAGIVHSVGANVYEFSAGDRVASFHEMMTSGGSFAEYAVGHAHTTFHIPKNVSFEEAATLPLAAMTAAIGLHKLTGMPEPWQPATSPCPLVVYGGASAVGAFVIKLAQRANIHPIIAVAGRAAPFVETLIDRSKGDAIVDYRKGNDALVKDIKDALNGQKLHYAFDAISEHGSGANIAQVIEHQGGEITFVLPGSMDKINPEDVQKQGTSGSNSERTWKHAMRKHEGVPESVTQHVMSVGSSHGADADYAFIMFRYMARGLTQGWFSPHPYEVVPGGLDGVEKGLRDLQDGKASGVKYVFQVGQV
ncbi:alcohol dehydrogenase [Pyrenophora seminiperda CCB06]|uniref:Alcohol dehydrogenase n=1 Tax=Pyrenophora seminiperda CCB06 TaxID=1302712 RepID=A0A3M7MF76_9PLEO|nr:alcohol dehydrogenase [Pyrenophora seminiperda CCB06]